MSSVDTSIGQGGDFAKGPAGNVQPPGMGITTVAPFLAPGSNLTATSTSSVTLPSGSIIAFAGSVAPAGYVLCDGSTYDGTTANYQNLFATIGITYGGSGASAFKVPDLQGRVPVGKGTNASVNALANSDGVALANRRPHHRHTPHSHTYASMHGSGPSGFAGGSNTYDSALSTGTSDGGSGVATDALDAPAYLVINYLIAL